MVKYDNAEDAKTEIAAVKPEILHSSFSHLLPKVYNSGMSFLGNHFNMIIYEILKISRFIKFCKIDEYFGKLFFLCVSLL